MLSVQSPEGMEVEVKQLTAVKEGHTKKNDNTNNNVNQFYGF
jgi:hypothetical protein